MIESMLARIADLSDTTTSDLTYEVYGGQNFVTVLVYCRTSPLVVCRIPRSSATDLESEYANLRQVGELTATNDFLRQTTEQVITVLTVGGRRVLLKRFLPGVKAGELPSEIDAVGRLLQSGTRWLVEFAAATKDRRVYEQNEKRRRLGELTDSDVTIDVDTLAAREDFFLGPMHGDFAPGNILLGVDGRLTGVVDFEGFAARGVPLFDLVHLCVNSGKLIYDTPEAVIENTFFAETKFAEYVAEYATRYRRALGVSTASLNRALSLYPAIRSSHGHRPGPLTERLRSVSVSGPEESWL
jgi:hypothetical protein